VAQQKPAGKPRIGSLANTSYAVERCGVPRRAWGPHVRTCEHACTRAAAASPLPRQGREDRGAFGLSPLLLPPLVLVAGPLEGGCCASMGAACAAPAAAAAPLADRAWAASAWRLCSASSSAMPPGMRATQ